uniref:Uncharacterized protein n=1 Tax=Arundo donax TaxID=35708 RepID=A0A0A9PWG1_ARUDO
MAPLSDGEHPTNSDTTMALSLGAPTKPLAIGPSCRHTV